MAYLTYNLMCGDKYSDITSLKILLKDFMYKTSLSIRIKPLCTRLVSYFVTEDVIRSKQILELIGDDVTRRLKISEFGLFYYFCRNSTVATQQEKSRHHQAIHQQNRQDAFASTKVPYEGHETRTNCPGCTKEVLQVLHIFPDSTSSI